MSAKIIASAPGKVILHGEYAVVFGKNAIATSVNLRTTVELDIHDSGDEVKLILKSFDQEFVWSIDALKSVVLPDNSHDSNVIEQSPEVGAILDKIIGNAHIPVDSHNSAKAFLFLLIGISQVYSSSKFRAVTVTVNSEFPVGAGLGSSAAFSVALTGAVFRAFGGGNEDSQLVSNWAFQCERLFHGKPSGIDNSICTFGGAILFKEGKIVQRLSSAEVPQLPVILVYTNVRRNTKVLVESATKRRENFPEVIAGTMNAIDAISSAAWVALQQESLDKKRYNLLVDMNQHLLNVLGAGHESIDQVAKLAKKHGCIAKLTGAGGGGCVLVHLAQDLNHEKVNSLKEDLVENGFQHHWLVGLGGSGLTFP